MSVLAVFSSLCEIKWQKEQTFLILIFSDIPAVLLQEDDKTWMKENRL